MPTYYIGPVGVGNNANPGTEVSPWLTLAYANTNASAGDTIIFLAGAYTGANVKATISKKLSIRGPNYGINPVTQARGDEAVLNNNASASLITLDSTAGESEIDGLKFTGGSYERVINIAAGAHSCVISNNIIEYTAYRTGIYANGANNLVIKNNYIIKGAMGLDIRNSSNHDIYGNKFYQIKRQYYAAISISSSTTHCDNIKIHDNIIDDVHHSGSAYAIAYGSATWSSVWHVRDIEIYNNVCTTTYGSSHAYGFVTFGTIENDHVHDNTLSGFINGYYCNHSAKGSVIEGNVITSDNGIYYSDYYNATTVGVVTIRRNTFHADPKFFSFSWPTIYIRAVTGMEWVIEDNTFTYEPGVVGSTPNLIWGATWVGGRVSAISMQGSKLVGVTITGNDIDLEGVITAATLKETNTYVKDVNYPRCAGIDIESDSDEGVIACDIVVTNNTIRNAEDENAIVIYNSNFASFAYGELGASATADLRYNTFENCVYGVHSGTGTIADATYCNWGGEGVDGSANYDQYQHTTRIGRRAFSQKLAQEYEGTWDSKSGGWPGGNVEDPRTGRLAQDETAAKVTEYVYFDPTEFTPGATTHRVRRGRLGWRT